VVTVVGVRHQHADTIVGSDQPEHPRASVNVSRVPSIPELSRVAAHKSVGFGARRTA
jgi:hypothetical protein